MVKDRREAPSPLTPKQALQVSQSSLNIFPGASRILLASLLPQLSVFQKALMKHL